MATKQMDLVELSELEIRELVEIIARKRLLQTRTFRTPGRHCYARVEFVDERGNTVPVFKVRVSIETHSP